MSCWLYRSEELLECVMKITNYKRRPMSCWLYRSEESLEHAMKIAN